VEDKLEIGDLVVLEDWVTDQQLDLLGIHSSQIKWQFRKNRMRVTYPDDGVYRAYGRMVQVKLLGEEFSPNTYGWNLKTCYLRRVR